MAFYLLTYYDAIKVGKIIFITEFHNKVMFCIKINKMDPFKVRSRYAWYLVVVRFVMWFKLAMVIVLVGILMGDSNGCERQALFKSN